FGADTCLRAAQTTVNYSHVETAALYGSTGPDIFNVIPSGTVALQIYGGNPLPPALPGDQINLAMTGVTGAVFNAGGSAGLGQYTFSNRKPVTVNGIETLADITPPAVLAQD